MIRRPPRSTLFPTRRSSDLKRGLELYEAAVAAGAIVVERGARFSEDRKSTRLNSSHLGISYAVFCLKKKNKNKKTDNYTLMIQTIQSHAIRQLFTAQHHVTT